MTSPLWTTRYAPTLSELPQSSVSRHLGRVVDEPINLLIHGPPGCGKTAAARALADESLDDPDNDFVEINVADVFERTKSEITADPRFAPFLAGRSSMSKRDMINHVLRESTAHAPVSGQYKTVVLDNAETVREDFQQALRRIMERHYRSTQFLLLTRQPSKLIPPLRSRCFQIAMRAPTSGEIEQVLESIVSNEGVEYDSEGLQFIAGYADGNLREAILAAQTVAVTADSITMQTAYETLDDIGHTDDVRSMIDDALAGSFMDARSTLDSLLIDAGLSGEEILQEVLGVLRSRYHGDDIARIHAHAASIDFDMTRGKSDRIHLANFLAALPATVE